MLLEADLHSLLMSREDYMSIIGLFHCCTEENPDKRPSAATVLNALEPIITQKEITV